MAWNPLETLSDPLRLFLNSTETPWNPLEPLKHLKYRESSQKSCLILKLPLSSVKLYWKPLKHDENCPNILTFQTLLKSPETAWISVKLLEIYWTTLNPLKILWNTRRPLESARTSWYLCEINLKLSWKSLRSPISPPNTWTSMKPLETLWNPTAAVWDHR